MSTVLKETNFDLPGVEAVYHGKVRDVYSLNSRLIIVATDRISAFDTILPRAIPYKGQVLNQIAAHFLTKTAHVVPNWLQSLPDPCVSVGYSCKPVKVEMVVRGYLAGHAWRLYRDGARSICGQTLPEGLRQNDKLPQPIITPTTKATHGHDEDVTREQIIQSGVVTDNIYSQMEKYSLALFEAGTKLADGRGLILVDTKYEFGIATDGRLVLIDEVHTPDSSRYFYADGYQQRQQAGQPQRQLSKEFVREWLIENGFQGKPGQTIPTMTDEIVSKISQRYIELYEQITGQAFKPATLGGFEKVEDRILHNIKKYFTR